MSQTDQRDPEEGYPLNVHPDQPQVTPNQPPSGESNFGDSSGPLFSLYSEITKEEDSKMADRWQKDADGILIFTGLFSAAVAQLLAVSLQDLRPNSQDTSAFYLANIYQILADPNFTLPRTSIPSSIATPPPFSPPRYSVWVNSLWFLSLVISLTCALLATSLHQWARRYIKFTQPARCSPEKRARIRAFFADGMSKMRLPYVVEALPAMIHLSLFLFFSGLIIFLFNINHSVFTSVIWWIGPFSMGYGWIMLMPIFRPDSPYYAPLSLTAWSLHAFIPYALFTVLKFITTCSRGSFQTWSRFNSLSSHYGNRMLGGVLMAAERATSNRSPEIDLGILDWTIGALGEDATLERFFEAIPGFFDSQMVKNLQRPLPDTFRRKFIDSLRGFLGRNLLSNSVNEEVKARRLVVGMNATKETCDSDDICRIFGHLSSLRFDQVPQSIQIAQILTPWCHSSDNRTSLCARHAVASILPHVRERDDRWIALAEDQYGVPEHIVRDNIAHGDNSVLLSILIHVTRQVVHTDLSNSRMLWLLSRFDIYNTHPRLQNDFCALWNEIVQEARDARHPHVGVLRDIRRVYIALHQGTDAAPTAFSASTSYLDVRLVEPSSYPLCNITAHRSNATGSHPTQLDDANDPSPNPSPFESHPSPDGSTDPQHVEETNIIPGPPSSAGRAAFRAQELPSTSLTISHVPSLSDQVTSVADHTRQSTLSTADIPANNQSTHLTTNIYTGEAGETTQF